MSEAKKLYIALLDNEIMFSGRTRALTDKQAKPLLERNAITLYNLKSARRIINLDGKEMTWSEYLKHL